MANHNILVSGILAILVAGILAIACGLVLGLVAPSVALAQSTPASIKSAADLPVWKMITVGTQPSVNALL